MTSSNEQAPLDADLCTHIFSVLRLERFADAVFFTAMGLMVATCLIVTYAIAAT